MKCTGISWCQSGDHANELLHAIFKVTWIVCVVAMMVVGKHKSIHNTQHDELILETPARGLCDEVRAGVLAVIGDVVQFFYVAKKV